MGETLRLGGEQQDDRLVDPADVIINSRAFDAFDAAAAAGNLAMVSLPPGVLEITVENSNMGRTGDAYETNSGSSSSDGSGTKQSIQ